MHGFTDVKVSRDDDAWEAVVSAEIPAESLAKHRGEALKEIQKTAKLDGFRPGHAPLDRILAVYGEQAVLREAVERTIQNGLPELLAAEKLFIIEAPRVETTAPESGKPVSFTARAPLAPEVTLPDFRKIADAHGAKKEAASVSDEEHAQASIHLRRERARIEKMEAGLEPQKAHEESRAMKEEELPALDDAFVRSLGYESAEKFSEALRANIKNEKEMQAREKVRAAILDELVERSNIRYPASLRAYELDDMWARLEADLKQMGATTDAYLAQTKKTQEQIRGEWKDAADKRAKVRLILSEIARKENIDADSATVDNEVAHAKQHYPQADEGALRAHISHAMRNEAVLHFLETGSKDFTPAPTQHDHEH